MDSETKRDQPVAENERTEPGLAELSNAMVRLYKEQFGRGPTKARTDYAGPDLLIITLEETLTPAEQKMLLMGQPHRLREDRMILQYATERDFVGTVQRITGRRVRAYVSGIDTEHDVSCEVFYLEPRS